MEKGSVYAKRRFNKALRYLEEKIPRYDISRPMRQALRTAAGLQLKKQ